MPNPYHFRARIDRLVQQGFGDGPAYLQLKALDTLVRELHAPNDRARANYKMYLATDPYDVARHKLRDLHDGPGCLLPPLPLGEGWGEGSPVLNAAAGPAQDEQPADEDDDPL